MNEITITTCLQCHTKERFPSTFADRQPVFQMHCHTCQKPTGHRRITTADGTLYVWDIDSIYPVHTTQHLK